MKRFILTAIGILILMSFVPVSVHAQDATSNLTVRVDREESVRNGPGTQFDLVGHLAAGTVMRVTSCNADCSWLEVAPAIWISASQATPVITSSQPNGNLVVGSPAAANAAAPLPTPIPTPVPAIVVSVDQNNVPSVTTQAPQQMQLISAQDPGMLEVATPVVMQAEELPAAQPTSASIAAVTPIPPLVLASANASVSQVPETPRAITTVIAPGTEVDGLKEKATSYNVRELTRNTENYVGHFVAYYGRVIQVLEDNVLFSDQVTITLRIAVDNDYENVIAAKLVYEDGQGSRPVVDDRLTIWGTVEGLETYTDVQGAEVMLPTVHILYLETGSDQESTAEVVSADGSTISGSPTLKVQSHTTRGSKNYLYIYGEVQNQSNYPVDEVKVVVVMRDDNGDIVDMDYRYSLLGTIPANGKSPFSIGFASWKGVTSYNISVESERGEPDRQDLVIRIHNSIVDGSSLRIAGEVANTGTTPAQSAKVIFTLYNNSGRVVGSDYAYKTLGAIPPGGTAAFSTATSLPKDYSYYEIQVEEW